MTDTPQGETPVVEVVALDGLAPDPSNANKHREAGKKFVLNSISRRGVLRGLGAAGKGVDKPVIKAGNLTLEKAKEAGVKRAILVHTTGDDLVINVRDDLAPDSPEAVMLGLEDNQTAHVSYEIDREMLASFMEGDTALLADLMRIEPLTRELLDQMEAEFLDGEDHEFKEYDESIADGVEVCECPTCGHKHAKKD